jgi:hypothetical protein
MRFLATMILLLAFLAFGLYMSLHLTSQSASPPLPTVSIAMLTTPTTVAVTGPVILNAIHNQATLETASMSFALDQDLSKTWGVEGVCQESVTYLGYFNVTAGIDLRQIGEGDVVVQKGATLAETAITITLPPADITHLELDTQRSRVVHNQISILSQLCGTHMADMVVEVQSNLQKRAETAALEKDIILMAQDRAGFALQKLLLSAGFSNVTIKTRSLPLGGED